MKTCFKRALAATNFGILSQALFISGASAETLKVLTTGAFKQVLVAVAADFEKRTREGFQATVRNAHKVALINPASGGSIGIYLEGLFQRMGMADKVKAKAVLLNGGLVAEKIVTGEADLANTFLQLLVSNPGKSIIHEKGMMA